MPICKFKQPIQVNNDKKNKVKIKNIEKKKKMVAMS